MCECSSRRSSTAQRIQHNDLALIALPPRTPAPAPPPPIPSGDIPLVDSLPDVAAVQRRCAALIACVQSVQSLAELRRIEEAHRELGQAVYRQCTQFDDDGLGEYNQGYTFYLEEVLENGRITEVTAALTDARIRLSIAQAAVLPFSHDAPLPAPDMGAIGFRMVNPDRRELRPFVQWVRTGTAPSHLNCQEGVVYALASAGRVTRAKIAQVLQINDATLHVQWDDRVFATQWTALQDQAQSQPIPSGAVVVFGENSGGHIALHLGGGQFFSIWGAHPDRTVVSLAEMLRHTSEMNGQAKLGTNGALLQ